MKPFLAFGLGLLASISAAAQSTPVLAVDAAANVHAISPYIYGINEWSDNGLLGMMRVPLLRWGGDDATSFNWQNSVKNNTGDNPWCFENYGVKPRFRRVSGGQPCCGHGQHGNGLADGLVAEILRRMQFQREKIRRAESHQPRR